VRNAVTGACETQVCSRASGSHIKVFIEKRRIHFCKFIYPNEENGFELKAFYVLDIENPDIAL